MISFRLPTTYKERALHPFWEAVTGVNVIMSSDSVRVRPIGVAKGYKESNWRTGRWQKI